jgi:CRISPR-associated endonuclease Csn1
MSTAEKVERVLGLDVGVASVGWCLLETQGGQAHRIVGMGSRIFPAGVEGNLDAFKLGRDEPRNQKRRMARQMRRQLWRRRRRLLKLQRFLVSLGLLPKLDAYDPDAIDRGFKALDKQLMAADPLMADRRGAQVFHYRLRARASAGAVSAFELGRALYHLAQHRGFLSNRKAARKEGEEDGEVKEGIENLKQAIAASGLPTLGAYFASLDPEVDRIRGRWLGRNELIVPEFEAIRQEQSKHHPTLSDGVWEEVHKAIFRQRPLRDQSHLIGRCSLEEGERRCPAAYPEAQRFRILQQVNHLRLVKLDEEGREVSERPLSDVERQKLIGVLASDGDLTMPQAKKALGYKSKEVKFSIERGGEKRLIGDRTHSRFTVEVGVEPIWSALSPDDRRRLIDDLLEYESQDALAKRLQRRWGFERDAARSAAEFAIEQARLRFSLKAIRRMLPFLEVGQSVQEAKIAAYPEHAGADNPWDLLPPLKPDRVWREHCSGGRKYDGIEVKNPAVERSLSEVRKVVNAVIRRWGRPDEIRIELARDLKKPRKEREAESGRMREQEAWRNAALQKMVAEGFELVAERRSRSDIEKVLLWEECGGVCPYTGKAISFEDLFGQSPRFEVEHIIPYSLSLEDGFGNKTLCEVNENRNRKKRMSPYDAYHGTPEWDAIIARVRHFKGRSAMKKAKLFQSAKNGQEIFGDFTERQLNDTRYASRLSSDYLALLFGGKSDIDRRQRIFVSAGGATAVMRRKLGLERVLGGSEKNRKDHRHHAIDALTIALTGPREVRQIAHASELAMLRGEAAHRLKIDAPWESFAADVQRVVDAMVVSHRVDRRLSGPMHQETNYSRPIKDIRGAVANSERRHLRCGLDGLSAKDVAAIVDPAVRRAVEAQLASLGEADPKIAFKGGRNLPTLRHGDGRDVPIRKVRIRIPKAVDVVGRAKGARFVAPGSNHHLAVLAPSRPNTQPREFRVVTMLEAYRRKSRGEPIVAHDCAEGDSIRCTIRSGDTVLLNLDGRPVPCVVSSVSDGQFELKTHTDARAATEIRQAGKEGGRLKFAERGFKDRFIRKLMIDPLGADVPAHD